jgi:hypothetical protein
VVSEGVVSVHAETKQHIERLKAEAGDEWDTGRAVRAALALSLAEEIDAGGHRSGAASDVGVVEGVAGHARRARAEGGR